jgi:hypothetical protein
LKDNTTRQIGLTGPDYSSDPKYLNGAGQVVGGSYRSFGEDEYEFVAWFYDSHTDETTQFALSERGDGYVFSRVDDLGEDGLVLGAYSQFEGDRWVGERPFYFQSGGVPTDFGLLVGDEFNARAWNDLNVYRIDGEDLAIIRAYDESFVGHDFVVDLAALRQEHADFDGDGIVDGEDLSTWQTHFGAIAMPYANGDANGDGDVDGADFLAWQRSLHSPSSEINASAIPEPHPLLQALTGVGLAASRRPRRAGLVSHALVRRCES